MEIPPNLKIDPRSTCSPFYGMERAAANVPQEKEAEEENDDAQEQTKEKQDMDAQEDAEDEDDDDELWIPPEDDTYYAIPLPERLHASIYDLKDSETSVGTIWLNDQVFAQDPIRVDLIQRAVLYYRNKKRGRRTAITKTISEISGSGRKVRPQKGQGTARAGHSRPAHWRGGYKAHGPKGFIQNYANTKLNKKVKRLSLMHMLSQKLKEGNIWLITDLTMKTHKTKELASLLQPWNVAHRHGTTALLLDHVVSEEIETLNKIPVHVMVASRNLYKIKVINTHQVNVYDLLKYEKVFITLSGLTALEERLTVRQSKQE